MSSIYVFDIESLEWIVQTITDLNGDAIDDVAQADGKNLDPPQTFPSRRMSACAASGSSQDKTSHNIVLIGGQNDVTALADAWVLSLPRHDIILSVHHFVINGTSLIVLSGSERRSIQTLPRTIPLPKAPASF
jgi:hypothetical protein